MLLLESSSRADEFVRGPDAGRQRSAGLDRRATERQWTNRSVSLLMEANGWPEGKSSRRQHPPGSLTCPRQTAATSPTSGRVSRRLCISKLWISSGPAATRNSARKESWFLVIVLQSRDPRRLNPEVRDGWSAAQRAPLPVPRVDRTLAAAAADPAHPVGGSASGHAAWATPQRRVQAL